MAVIAYYNVSNNLEYEEFLLKEWGIEGLELVAIEDKEYKRNFVKHIKEIKAEGLVIDYQPITKDIMDNLPDLKIISLLSIGYDNIDIQEATKHGICITNISGYCVEEVASHSIALMLDLVRKITYFDRTVRNGSWEPLKGYKIFRITGMTCGLVFFGDIPKQMTPILQALKLRVLVYEPTKNKEYLAKYGCEKAKTLEELLEKSDIVSLHCPLITNITYHLIGERELKKMKQSAFIINTARGSIIDEPALVKALKKGWIKGAGIDVIEDEVNKESDLFDLDNVVITPHAAFVSDESIYEGRKRALKQIVMRLSEKVKPSLLINKDIAINL